MTDTTQLKFNKNHLFDFYVQAFKACGVTIHNSIHMFSTGDADVDWPEGYYLFFLMNLTYKNQTRWYYHRGDCCPGCWPRSFFNGGYTLKKISPNGECVNRWKTCTPKPELGRCAVCYCGNDEVFYKQCVDVGIPEDALKEFVDGHFTNYDYYCDRCQDEIVDQFVSRCVDCTTNYRNLTNDKVYICGKCVDDHDPEHTKLDKTVPTEKYTVCEDCMKVIIDTDTYECIDCSIKERDDLSIDFCLKCLNENKEFQIKLPYTKVPTMLNHTLSHNVKHVENPNDIRDYACIKTKIEEDYAPIENMEEIRSAFLEFLAQNELLKQSQ